MFDQPPWDQPDIRCVPDIIDVESEVGEPGQIWLMPPMAGDVQLLIVQWIPAGKVKHRTWKAWFPKGGRPAKGLLEQLPWWLIYHVELGVLNNV